MTKNFKDIVATLDDVIKIIGNPERQITGIIADSRKAEAGKVFVAVQGTQTDGYKYVREVKNAGINTFICEKMPEQTTIDECYIVVRDAAKALSLAACAFYDNPSHTIKVIGVTGTNGKTTIATLLYHLFTKAGYQCGLISTVTYSIGTEEYESSHTTPDSLTINEMLWRMLQQGCQYCFMEVSSHALHQRRVAGLRFSVAIFTNITHDHLDYHKTFDEYIRVKKSFFDTLEASAVALVNTDDKHASVMVQNTQATIKTYAMKSMADYTVKIIESHLEGMMLRIGNKDIWVHFIGEFNALNILAVYAAAQLLGLHENFVEKEISNLKPVNGRFDYVVSPRGVTAIVDYAHTPDALSNVLKTIKKITGQTQGKIITVLGAGGNRDKLKRPKMAAISVNYSNAVILTSDNPRYEKAEDIINDMLTGVEKKDTHKVLTITDRKQAIRIACNLAQKGDFILIAGKGHENYQEIEGVRYHFNDKEIVNEILK